ncbi:hypothetical protein GCM10023216_14700 [Isoptericola chiayiensis]|uniref:DUF3592 domain-containing protein n=1 Tax=Isoptericola chiayiensis TaxID=579446 RepID=A0ABP8YCI8_9MICO|nr:DUF3592 domain-containing protein [Isoptericola chiayiensis]NOW02100.1 hypothetical protein [Isoptericola chiayiensis]
MTDVTDTAAFGALTVVVALLLSAGCAVYVVVMWRRQRAYANGVRGTAVVIGIEATPWAVRHNHFARATETVTVATHQCPHGVRQERIPPGQYVVGQTVEVVQPEGRPDLVRLDRADVVGMPRLVWGFAAMAVLAPVIALRGLAS